jgi:hypothetical protein
MYQVPVDMDGKASKNLTDRGIFGLDSRISIGLQDLTRVELNYGPSLWRPQERACRYRNNNNANNNNEDCIDTF